MVAETFGVRLTRLRKATGTPQSALAQQVGVRQSLLSMLERGHRDGLKLQAGIALALARVLHVSVEYLLTGAERQRSRTHCLPRHGETGAHAADAPPSPAAWG